MHIKACLHVTFLAHVRYYHHYCSLYCHQSNGKKIGPSPILSVVHTTTIDTLLNVDGGNNGHGLNNVTCKQTLCFVHT